MKIGYSHKDGMIRVSIDEKNSGKFHTCFVESTHFTQDWWKTAHIGIAASTGQLADNHDILSVETEDGEGNPDNVAVSESKVVKELEEEETSAFRTMMAKRSINPSMLTAQENAIVRVMEAVDQRRRLDISKLKRELDESLNNMIKKLQQSSDISESRIFDIEQTLKRDVQSSINTKLEKRVKAIEDVFDAHLKEAVKKSNKAWMIPFVLLVVVIAFVLLFVYVGMGRECEV